MRTHDANYVGRTLKAESDNALVVFDVTRYACWIFPDTNVWIARKFDNDVFYEFVMCLGSIHALPNSEQLALA